MMLRTTKPSTALRIVAGAGALALFAATSLAAQGMSPQCSQAYGAMTKLYDKPFHMYMIDSAATDARLHGGKPTTSESVYVGGIAYLLIRGKWIKSPVDLAAMRKDAEENMKTNKVTCTHLRDDNVKGESVAVWNAHTVTEEGTSDNELWISKSRGVVLRTDIKQDVGGALGRSHMVATYDYANVQAPAGVK